MGIRACLDKLVPGIRRYPWNGSSLFLEWGIGGVRLLPKNEMKYSNSDMKNAIEIRSNYESTNMKKSAWEQRKYGGRKKKSNGRSYKNRVPRQYKVYIKSDWWKKRKDEYYRKYGKKCSICSSPRFVQLHHLVYGNYGHEKDEHLVPLCSSHHASLHSHIGVKGNMIAETVEFIDETRQLLEFPVVE